MPCAAAATTSMVAYGANADRCRNIVAVHLPRCRADDGFHGFRYRLVLEMKIFALALIFTLLAIVPSKSANDSGLHAFGKWYSGKPYWVDGMANDVVCRARIQTWLDANAAAEK